MQYILLVDDVSFLLKIDHAFHYEGSNKKSDLNIVMHHRVYLSVCLQTRRSLAH